MADLHPSIATTAASVVELLRQKELQLATAESCTAGLLSAAITAVPGASDVFGCGVAAYSAQIKHEMLGVPQNILEQYGTVSSRTAAAMADGVRRISGAAIGVAITGVAGPAPSEGKPVGTVHIALANEQRVWLQELTSRSEFVDRETVRNMAVATALSMIEKYAEAYPAMVAGSIPLSPPQINEIIIPEPMVVHGRRRFLATILPWRGDSLKERLIKSSSIVLSLGFLVAAAFGITQLINRTENRSLYSDLQDMYTDEQNNTIDSVNNDMLPRFTSLHLQNADIGGWIRIDGTGIDYPVMKNAGSDYYANHNFHQQASAYGVPFFDSRNSLISPQEKNKALIIYGNNTGDEQMFSNLLEYHDVDFFKENMLVEMSTLYHSDKWVLFGVMVLDPEEINAFAYATTSFENDEAFLQHVADIRSRSMVNTNVQVTADDQLLLLVTQAEEKYGFDNATLVVVGRRLRNGEAFPGANSAEITRNTTVLMPRVWVRMNQNVTTTTTKTQSTIKNENTTTNTEQSNNATKTNTTIQTDHTTGISKATKTSHVTKMTHTDKTSRTDKTTFTTNTPSVNDDTDVTTSIRDNTDTVSTVDTNETIDATTTTDRNNAEETSSIVTTQSNNHVTTTQGFTDKTSSAEEIITPSQSVDSKSTTVGDTDATKNDQDTTSTTTTVDADA